MPRCKDKPTNLDKRIMADVAAIRAQQRTPQAKVAAKLARAAEAAKVKAKVERDKKEREKPVKDKGVRVVVPGRN